MKDFGLVNCYIKDADRETVIDRPILLLFRPKNVAVFNNFVERCAADDPDFREDYDYPGGLVVMVFEFPEKYKADYDVIIKGQYSKVGAPYIDLFPERDNRFLSKKDGKPMPHITYSILTKAKWLRRERAKDLLYDEWPDDWELWEMFDEEKETLTIKKLEYVVQ